MSLKIRRGIFETNSSSTHTLVFHKIDPRLIADNTVMEIHGGYYGRCPNYPLKTTQERLNYLWQAIWDSCIEYFDYDKQEYCSDYEELNTWKTAIHLYCPNAILYDVKEEDWFGIDHSDNLRNLLQTMKNDIFLLKYYLLDPDGYVVITGDEYEANDENQFFNPDEVPTLDNWENQDTLIKLDHDTFLYEKGN